MLHCPDLRSTLTSYITLRPFHPSLLPPCVAPSLPSPLVAAPQGDLLGQGGFADVHAAELSDALLPSFSEAVAVKRLRPDVLQGPDDLREFLTEANLLRKLQHRWGGGAVGVGSKGGVPVVWGWEGGGGQCKGVGRGGVKGGGAADLGRILIAA
jgi:hypothetical protein